MSRYKPIYHIRLVITDIKSYSTYTQLSKVELYRHIDYFHDVPISWDGTTVTCNKQATSSGEGASNLIDGSVDTKACFDSGVPSSENPVIITFSNQDGFDLTPNEYDDGDWGVYKRPVHWRWYTADDSPERDPVTYKLQISYNGIKWETVEDIDRDHWTVTDNRKTEAYSGDIRLYPRHKPIDLTDLSYIKQYIDANDLALDINTQTITTEYTLYDIDTYAENGVSVYYVNIPNYTICGRSAVGIIMAINIYYKIFFHTSSGSVCVNHDDGHWYELASKSAIPTNISQLNNNRDFVNGIWIGEDFYEPQDDPDSPQEDAISVFLPKYPSVEESNTNGNIIIDGTETNVYTHPGSGTNPHGTTASDVGLGNVHVQDMNTSGELRSIDDIYENVVFNKGFFAGSASITNDSVLPGGWYNVVWIPHRTGVGGDNMLYGNFICIPITSDSSTWYIVRFSAGSRAQTVPMKEFSGSFNDLTDKPSINSVELSGNKTASELGLQTELDGAQTVSGNPITITDAEAMNAEDVKVELEPKQDLHGYDAPWVGGAGKNEYPIMIGREYFEDNAGATHTTDADELTITTSSALHSGVYSSYLGSELNNLSKSLNGTYTCSFDIKANKNARLIVGYQAHGEEYIDATTSWQRVHTTTVFDGIGRAYVIYNLSGEDISVNVRNFMLEQGSTATTFAPYSNICPITGYSEVNLERVGKNKCPAYTSTETQHDVTIAGNSEGEISVNGTLDGTELYGFILNNSISLEAGTYTLNGANPNGAVLLLYDSNDNLLAYTANGRQTFTLESTTTAVLRMFVYANVQYDEVVRPMIRKSTESADFEPYQGSTATISLGGTKYGGTLDVTEGVLTVDRVSVDLSSLTWEVASRNRWNAHIDGMRPFENDFVTTAISDSFVATTMSQLYNDENYIAFACTNVSDVYVRNGSTTDTPTGQLVYELATPLTIHLTPTQIQMLENTNNVSTDGTNIQLKYQPNNVIGECKAYTDEQIEKIPMPSGYKETIVWKYTGNEQAMPHGFPATTITINNTTAPGFKLKKALRFYFRGYKMIVVPGQYPNYGLQSQEILTAFMSSGDSVRVKLQGSFIDNNNSVYRRQAILTYTKTGDDESLEVAFDVCSNGNNTNNDYIIPLYITTVDYELDSLVSLS